MVLLLAKGLLDLVKDRSMNENQWIQVDPGGS